MAEKVARLARPSSTLEEPGVFSGNGINRSQLTLYLSIAAIVLSVASAGVHLVTFFGGERQKRGCRNRTRKDSTDKRRRAGTRSTA